MYYNALCYTTLWYIIWYDIIWYNMNLMVALINGRHSCLWSAAVVVWMKHLSSYTMKFQSYKRIGNRRSKQTSQRSIYLCVAGRGAGQNMLSRNAQNGAWRRIAGNDRDRVINCFDSWGSGHIHTTYVYEQLNNNRKHRTCMLCVREAVTIHV